MSKATKTSIPTKTAPKKPTLETRTTKLVKTNSISSNVAKPKAPIGKESLTKQKSKDDDKKILLRSKPSNLKQKPERVESKQQLPAKPKIISSTRNVKPKMETKTQPLRARPIPAMMNKINTIQANAVSKTNVMNTIHNVTVASPPPVRKNSLPEDHPPRDRTRTRTLDPDEVLILKNPPQEPKSLDSVFGGNIPGIDSNFGAIVPKIPIKEPVSFEVNFIAPSKSYEIQIKAVKETEKPKPPEIQTKTGAKLATVKPSEIQTKTVAETAESKLLETQKYTVAKIATSKSSEIQIKAVAEREKQKPPEIQTKVGAKVSTSQPSEIQTKTVAETAKSKSLETQKNTVSKRATSNSSEIQIKTVTKTAISKSSEIQTNSFAKTATLRTPEIQTNTIAETATTSKRKKSESSESDEPDYEEDFESYESDFETGTSSSRSSPLLSTSSSIEESNISSIKSLSRQSSIGETTEPETGDESEETQLPVTVIQKDEERKLDSGNYDLNNSKKEKIFHPQQQQQQLDSLDTSTTNSEQLDSGISSYSPNFSVQSVGVVNNLTARPLKISKRGHELMQKIQLDTVSYTLFELKPINYEYYMKIYGNVHAEQASTQTNENRLDVDCQTDKPYIRSVWTQHPPQFDLKLIKECNYVNNLNNSFGEFENDFESYNDKENRSLDPIEKSIETLNSFRRNLYKREKFQKPVDFNRLNEFLRKSAFSISAILNKTDRAQKLRVTQLTVSNGFYNLNTSFLNATNIVQIFSNSKLNLILVVHENHLENFHKEFLNLISIWDVNESDKPFKLLSTWSEVCWAEICTEMPDIIVAGLKDGSIALWDLRESYSFSSKTETDLIHFAPTQSITPNFETDHQFLSDLGAVVKIKNFRPSTKFYSLRSYKSIQLATLNDSGILAIWTLVETGNGSYNNHQSEISKNSKMEYISPWARYKLIQSAICDLRDFLQIKKVRIKSGFEKTRSYFESDIFNDDALKELQETQNDLRLGAEGLRFTNLDVGVERIYIGTNRNFVLSCSKILKTDLFRKIIIDESKFLFATALKLLWNEEFLIVGLSNGSVIAVNCNPQKPNQSKKKISSSSSSGFGSGFRSRPTTGRSSDFETIGAKSCAIQNIIRNERKSFEMDQSTSNYDSMQSSSSNLNFDQIQGFDLRVIDQQILLGGLSLRKDLVQRIEISADGTKLLALMDGTVRVFDFILNKEVPSGTSDQITAISLAKGKTERQSLILLTKQNELQIHAIK